MFRPTEPEGGTVTESELEETGTGVADEGVDPARSIEPHNEGLV